MKAKIMLSAIMSVLLMVPCAFAQGAVQDPLDPNVMARFQKALEREGFEVLPGGGYPARGQHPANSEACEAEPVADPFTEALINDLRQSGFQVSQGCAMLYRFDDCIDHTYPSMKNTLATETGNAIYVGLSANDASMMAGVTNVLDSDVTDSEGNIIKGLKGSADSYGVENSGKFFVHYFTEDCAVLKDPGLRENCTTTQGVKPAIGDPALRGKFIIALRDYIATGTRSGPDPSKLLRPRILTFTQP